MSESIKLQAVADKIAPKTKVIVKGVMDYSHISSKLSDAELKEANKYTKYAQTVGYFKATLKVASGVADESQFDPRTVIEFDPSNASEATLAAYVGSRIYPSKKEENKGNLYYSAISKGNEIRVYKEDAEGKLHRVNLNGNELGPNNVKMELNFFKTSNGPGVGINSIVILDDDIKIYEGNVGVKGYDNDFGEEITLPKRIKTVEDGTPDEDESDNSAATETAKAEPTVDEAPIGETTSGGNDVFEKMLQQFKTN